MADVDLSALRGVLLDLQYPDNARIEQAERQLSQLRRSHGAALLLHLLQIAATGDDHVALMALLMARQSLAAYHAMQLEDRQHVQQALLQLMALSPTPAYMDATLMLVRCWRRSLQSLPIPDQLHSGRVRLWS